MVKFYKNRLSSIISFFKNRHPARFPILEKSFKVHRKGYFEVSIRVFLTQIEGLFVDLTEKKIFGEGKAEEWLKSKNNNNLDFRLAILESIKQNENLSANFDEAKDYPNALNRNRI